LIIIAPRTGEFSARAARRTTSPYHAGKSLDWVGKAVVFIVVSFVDVYRRWRELVRRSCPSGGSAYVGTFTNGGRGATAESGRSSSTRVRSDVMPGGYREAVRAIFRTLRNRRCDEPVGRQDLCPAVHAQFVDEQPVGRTFSAVPSLRSRIGSQRG
jgi:hypothetical protein